MRSQSPTHRKTMRYGAAYLQNLFEDEALVFAGYPITLKNSEPFPDIAIISGPEDKYDTRHPEAKDVFLLMEILCPTQKHDVEQCKATYAAEGVGAYWVLDTDGQKLHVFSNPENGVYQAENTYNRGFISLKTFPNIAIAVERLLFQSPV